MFLFRIDELIEGEFILFTWSDSAVFFFVELLSVEIGCLQASYICRRDVNRLFALITICWGSQRRQLD